MSEKSYRCLCHSFGPLCKACKEEPCTSCAPKTAAEVLKECKAARVAYANHRRKGSQGYGFNY